MKKQTQTLSTLMTVLLLSAFFNANAQSNLALNKSIVASSTYNGNYPAQYANDGNPSTYWACDKGGALPATITVTIANTPIPISSASLDLYIVSAYRLEANPGGVWTTIVSESGGSWGLREHQFATVNCTQVRIVITAGIAGPPVTGVSEIRIFGPAPQDVYANNLNVLNKSYFDGNIFAFGNVLIGKASQINTSYKLDVNGKARANEIVVNTNGADFVFEDGYKLRSLAEVEAFVKANKHLPEIAPAADMQANGVGVAQLQTQLLQKIEELTLYVIALKKDNEALKTQVEELKIQAIANSTLNSK